MWAEAGKLGRDPGGEDAVRKGGGEGSGTPVVWKWKGEDCGWKGYRRGSGRKTGRRGTRGIGNQPRVSVRGNAIIFIFLCELMSMLIK